MLFLMSVAGVVVDFLLLQVLLCIMTSWDVRYYQGVCRKAQNIRVVYEGCASLSLCCNLIQRYIATYRIIRTDNIFANHAIVS